MGLLFFGKLPTGVHTVDHDDKKLDGEGCLSNNRTNLLGWADEFE